MHGNYLPRTPVNCEHVQYKKGDIANSVPCTKEYNHADEKHSFDEADE